MTNARKARAERKEIADLIDQRNALLDILNAILLKAGGAVEIADSYYLGQARKMVTVVQRPGHLLIRREADLEVATQGPRLIVVPAGTEDARA